MRRWTGTRQYHIALERGELAEYVLLVGDPGRVAKVAARWDARRARAQQSGDHHRHGNVPRHAAQLHVDRHGHGQRRDRARRGDGDHRCAHLRPHRVVGRPPAGDRARRPDRLDRGRSTGEHDRLLRASGLPGDRPPRRGVGPRSGVPRAGVPVPPGTHRHREWLLRSAGTAMRTLPVRYPELAEELRRQRVANLEMESSALFVLAGLAGLRSGTICAAYAQRVGRHVPGGRGKGGRGGTLHRCRTDRHPPALADRHRGMATHARRSTDDRPAGRSTQRTPGGDNRPTGS